MARRIAKKSLSTQMAEKQEIEKQIAALMEKKKSMAVNKFKTWTNTKGKNYLMYKCSSLLKDTMLDRAAIDEIYSNYEAIKNAMDELQID